MIQALAVVAALLFLAGCGAALAPPIVPPDPTLLAVVDGVEVHVDPGVDTVGLIEEVGLAIRRSLTYWSAPASSLAGVRLYIRAEGINCGHPWLSTGCTFPEKRIEIMPVPDPPCRTLMLCHELGHIILPNDGMHTDPRWADTYSVTGC
jgi:hypothetical protein